MKAFYNGLREVYGPQNRETAQLLDQSCKTVLTAKNNTLKKFAQHFGQLLNVPGKLDQEALNSLKDMPPYLSLDNISSFNELLGAIYLTKKNKAPGECSILAEVWKYGRIRLEERLHDFTTYIWSSEKMPQNRKDANITLIFKRGSRKVFGNHRRISLLSIARKILARIILNKINVNITP